MNEMSKDLGTKLAEIKGAEVIKSFCYTCPWQCPTEVFVRDGRIVYQKGNPESPNNIGARCAKGMASWYVSQDPDRLTHPLLRTNPKGERGEFKQVSWDEAFQFIADKLKHIADEWGPEAVALTCHHDPNTVFYHHLLKDLYGSPNMYAHTSGCEQDRRSACLTLFGHVFPMHDFVNSKYVMLWGMNNLGANQGLWESRDLIEAQHETDVGPVIDGIAKTNLEQHITDIQQAGRLIARAPMPDYTMGGTFVAPTAIEIDSISQLVKENFGPILHVIRYSTDNIEEVIESINNTGFGLTFGIHSRNETFAYDVASKIDVGNVYINRNQIGAIVGVQPFGGRGMSGTGPKAGGPHYLTRFITEKTRSDNITAVGGNATLLSLDD